MSKQFRAWDKKQKRMFSFYGKYPCEADVFVLYDNGIWEIGESAHNWEVVGTNNQDGILMQSIGIEDFNKKPIYEGDILKDINFSNFLQKVVYNQNECKFEFITIKTGFSFIKINKEYVGKYMEIVGNIYEDENLLDNNDGKNERKENRNKN